ncbi:MAG: TatD family hydrolase [Acidobacteria bacterium]|nr:TatD family hydrolase [Acidobacteriota bacterium]
MFADSHTHLDSPEFLDDLAQVILRAREKEVREILTVGCCTGDVESLQRVLSLVEADPELYAAVGVHPHDARFYDQSTGSLLQELMSHPKVVAWGEIGLDFFYEHSPADVQRRTFREQLRQARKCGKPVIIHSRNAEEETCEILEEEFSGANGGVLHCFSHSRSTAERCLGLGFYISFGGIITFPKATDLAEIARTIPADRLLIETDCPYLAPVPRRGKRNEPAYVCYVAEKLAELQQVDVTEIATQTRENFKRLFLRSE